MKWTAIYQLTVLAATVAAVPSAAPEPISFADAEPIVMDPGHYKGDLKDRSLYDASGLHLLTDLAKRHVESRDSNIQKRNGWLYCGNLADGDRANAGDQIKQLRPGSWNIPARSCLRLKCWNTTGVYTCNDQGVAITVSGQAVWERAYIIQENCCRSGPNFGPYMTGQQFTDAQGGFNVLVGYANCNHSPTQPPSDFGNGGKCYRNQRYVT